MTVGELRTALSAFDDTLEILMRAEWKVADEPYSNQFALRAVTLDLDPDSAEEFVALDCDQDFE
jgi:hypothetical protein